MVLAAKGSTEEAEHLARQAVDLAFANDFFFDRAQSLLALAEVLRKANRLDDAREAAERGIAVLEAKGARVAVDHYWARWQ